MVGAWLVPESAGAAGKVKASKAYIEHFGQPPLPQQGECFVRVGFFPLRNAPGKVRAVPFFLFQEHGQLQLLLDRLASGEIPLPADGDLFDPFPPGTRILVQRQAVDTVNLKLVFSEALPTEAEWEGLTASLVETASQFEGIRRIHILWDGKSPRNELSHDPARIVPVAAPDLLMLTGSWEPGSDFPDEIVANFDRPVKIENFRLGDTNGLEFRGDFFQSIFNMAVVLHPANPAAFREGMSMRASWVVTDSLGRRGEGERIFRLQRHQHTAIPVEQK